MNLAEFRAIERYLTPAEREELNALLDADFRKVRWRPLPPKSGVGVSPQQVAWESRADITGYGGAAGGGKTDLIAGLVQDSTRHERALIVRREKAQTAGVVQRLVEIVGGTEGYNSQHSIWRIPGGALTEFAGLDNPGDEHRWQGRPHDLKAFDEVTEMREHQVRFIMGWTRTSNPRLRARVLMTFNPPTDDDGRWVLDFFGPWLQPSHPLYPTAPGVLRWCAMLPNAQGGSKDRWVADGRQFVLVDGEPCYEFNPADYEPEDIITPKSRTFIPARLTDNPIYMAQGYMSTLQSLPEPLRSQMLKGDFMAGVKDDEWQVCPSAWVQAAMDRWKPRAPRGEMLAMGVDVARGGKDSTTIATRHMDQQAGHGLWFDKPKAMPGADTPNGAAVAGFVIANMKDSTPVMIDVIGVGASPYDILNSGGIQVLGVDVRERARGKDKSGRLSFKNYRSELWWKMREALDPDNDTGIALPPDEALRKELCTPRWKPQGMEVYVESREDIIARLGHSPDLATAYVMALIDMPKWKVLRAANAAADVLGYDPMAAMRR